MRYEFDFATVLASWPQFLEGAWMTILLSFPATVIGFVGGTLLAIGRRSSTRWLSNACGAYVEVIRNTPLLVQVFLVFFGLASMGWKVAAFTAALLSLVINVAAYSSEIMRAGMDSARSKPPNAWASHAARCTGMWSFARRWRRSIRR